MYVFSANISSEIIRNAMAEIKKERKKEKRGIFRIKVARFKGSYDTHIHIPLYIDAAVSPCRVNLPSAKISIRAATLRLFK